MKINPGAQAKRWKTVGSGSGAATGAPASGLSAEPEVAAPTPAEPEITTSAPAAADPSAPFADPATAEAAATTSAPPASKPTVDDAAPPAPSSPPIDTSTTPDVVVTGAAFNPPACHVLAKHTGETSSSTPAKLELELPFIENLFADELHAGYLSRLNAHRSEELKLVNQLKKKYEETAAGLKDAVAASKTTKEVAEEKLRAAIKKLSEFETELSMSGKPPRPERPSLSNAPKTLRAVLRRQLMN